MIAVLPAATAVTAPFLTVTIFSSADTNVASAVTFLSSFVPSAFVVVSVTVRFSVPPTCSASSSLSTEYLTPVPSSTSTFSAALPAASTYFTLTLLSFVNVPTSIVNDPSCANLTGPDDFTVSFSITS